MLFKRMLEEERIDEKEKLNNALKDMEDNIKNVFMNVDDQIERSVISIQRAVRKMILRKRFRISLYKLMLVRNIIENKMHKERMSMLYAFE
jgi:hypothetical protein